jgi:hypothetical protein
MSAAMMISAIEQAMLMAETEGSEQLARGVQQLEGEIAAIQSIIEVALEAIGEDDPIRQDLEEIRTAARLAVAKAGILAQRTRATPFLRAI